MRCGTRAKAGAPGSSRRFTFTSCGDADKRGADPRCFPTESLVVCRAPNAVANAIGYAKHRSHSHDAVIRVLDETGNLRATHEQAGDFRFEQPLTILPCEDGAL